LLRPVVDGDLSWWTNLKAREQAEAAAAAALRSADAAEAMILCVVVVEKGRAWWAR